MTDPAAKRGPGQPPHAPTEQDRERVATLAGGGMSHEAIAMVIGVSRPTLEKHYERELSVGAFECRAEVIEAMRLAALKGNVSAAKYYLQFEPGLAAPPLPEEAPSEGPSKPLGKKAQQAEEAKTATTGSEWEGLLPGNVVPIRN